MATVLGINHVALDVSDVDRAVEFYTDVFDMDVRNREGRNAWLDCNGRFDFLALFEDDSIDPEEKKDGHWGLVIDDREEDLEAIRERAEEWGVEMYPKWDCSFWDPFGYRVEVIRLSDVSKPPTPYDVPDGQFEDAENQTV